MTSKIQVLGLLEHLGSADFLAAIAENKSLNSPRKRLSPSALIYAPQELLGLNQHTPVTPLSLVQPVIFPLAAVLQTHALRHRLMRYL